jgi:hypothetical protein
MRWAKHLTNARHDEKMALLLDTHGPAGYGVYWLIIEIIGGQVAENNTSVAYPERVWRKNLGVSAQKLRVFLDFFAETKLFSVENTQNQIVIDCPNILKYRDEWSERRAKNSGVTRESLGRNSRANPDTDTEEEIREEKKREDPPLTPPVVESGAESPEQSASPEQSTATNSGNGPNSPIEPKTPEGIGNPTSSDRNPLLDEFTRFWAAYPKHQKCGETRKLYMQLRIGGRLPPIDRLCAVIESHARSPDWRKEGGRYIPSPYNWLHDSHWLDKVDAGPAPAERKKYPDGVKPLGSGPD